MMLDHALATTVLSLEPSLLYHLGEPEDLIVIWKKLPNQLQKKRWVDLRRKLYSLRLKEGESVQKHIKVMIEVFEGLCMIPSAHELRIFFSLCLTRSTFCSIKSNTLTIFCQCHETLNVPGWVFEPFNRTSVTVFDSTRLQQRCSKIM